jgi:hypothetical protein
VYRSSVFQIKHFSSFKKGREDVISKFSGSIPSRFLFSSLTFSFTATEVYYIPEATPQQKRLRKLPIIINLHFVLFILFNLFAFNSIRKRTLFPSEIHFLRNLKYPYFQKNTSSYFLFKLIPKTIVNEAYRKPYQTHATGHLQTVLCFQNF